MCKKTSKKKGAISLSLLRSPLFTFHVLPHPLSLSPSSRGMSPAWYLVLLLLSLVVSGVEAGALKPIHSLRYTALGASQLNYAPVSTSTSTPTSTSGRATSHSHGKWGILSRMRGGESLASKPGAWTQAKTVFTDILPATRLQISLILFTTAVHLLGLPAPDLFSLDISRIVPQLWRPLTAVTYLGPPSMSWANSLYLLLKLGQALERSTGSATHLWFLITQTVMLSALGLLLNFPFQARALVAAVVFAWSRLSPRQPMSFQFGVQIQAWHLPFCLAAIDCLSHQSLAAAWPHLLGLLTAHTFLFSRQTLPALLQLQRQGPPRSSSSPAPRPSPSPSSPAPGPSPGAAAYTRLRRAAGWPIITSLLVNVFGTPQWLQRLPYLTPPGTGSAPSSSAAAGPTWKRGKKVAPPGHVLGSSQQ